MRADGAFQKLLYNFVKDRHHGVMQTEKKYFL